MNRLRKKFEKWLDTNPRKKITAIQCEQITDDFSIKFAEWLRGNYFDVFPLWNDEKTNKKYTTTELQQYFKENVYGR